MKGIVSPKVLGALSSLDKKAQLGKKAQMGFRRGFQRGRDSEIALKKAAAELATDFSPSKGRAGFTEPR